MFGESFNFFDPPTTKRWSFNFFAKLSGNDILIANFSKLRKYQTLVLIGLHNLSKSQLADRIFKLWKSCVYDYRAVEHTTLKFWFFKFFNFRTTFVKNFMKKLPDFKIYFESTDRDLPLHQYLWPKISRKWNNGPLHIFWNFYGRTFCFLNFVKWGKY